MNVCLFVSTEEFDPVSILIRERTECSWSHVGFYDLETKLTFSAMCDGKGVAWRPVGPHQKMLLLNHATPQPAMDLALTQIGKSYNELDIIGIAVGRDWSTADRYICSTLVLWSFEQANMPLLAMWAIPLDHMTPRDVLLSPYLKERPISGF
jgi:hypothetical protein